MAFPHPRIATGGRFAARARSAVVTTTAPPPSVIGQQSSFLSGPQILSEARTSSIVSGPRRHALGFRRAHSRPVTATEASCSSVVPYSCMWRAVMRAKWPMGVGIPVGRSNCAAIDSGAGGATGYSRDRFRRARCRDAYTSRATSH
ncbi:hypothetical protein [Actinomadura madurae]|uniref:hypothetical protein n=1 Tax=Actinomadura madurae TaxID=1993 RepID=UPI0035567E19